MRRITFFLLGLCLVARADIDSAYGELKRRAASRAPDVAVAQATLDQRRAALRHSWANWLPQAEVQLSQNQSKDYSFLTSGVLPAGIILSDPRQTNLSTWSLSVGLPLYRRSVHLGLQQGYREADAAELDLKIRIAELDWRLREAVGRYLQEAFKVEALETSLQIANRSLRETELRYELGGRTKIDLLRAQANVVSLDSRRLSFAQSREAGRNSILEVSGLSDAEFKDIGLEQGLKGEGALAQAVERFSDLGNLTAQIEPFLKPEAKLETRIAESSPHASLIASNREVAETRSNLLVAPQWPDLSVQGRLFKQAPDWGQAFASGQTSYSFGVVLKIPISLGGGLLWAHQESAAADRTAEVERARALRQLWSAVESEKLQVQALQNSAASFALNVKQNEEIVRLSSKSYELGKTTLVEYLGAQNDLLDAKINLTKAKIDLSVLARRFASHLGVGE
jgi:outer membrane protein TolC